MKTLALLALLLFWTGSVLAAQKYTKILETTITLTDSPCTMYESPPDIILFKAYAVDKAINQEAKGCYSVSDDGNVVINLVNITNGNQYGYVLPQAIFKNREYI